MERRRVLRLGAAGLALLGLSACGRAVHLGPISTGINGTTPDERIAQAKLTEYIPIYNKLGAFRDRYGVDVPVFSKIGSTLRSVIEGASILYDQAYIDRLGGSWGTKVTEASTIPIETDVSTLPQINQQRGRAYLHRTLTLMPTIRAISPKLIRIKPNTDDICGIDTGGCTDNTSHISMDDVTADPAGFYFITLHEVGHNIQENLANYLEYFFENQFLLHYDNYADFFIELGIALENMSPDVLIDYGVYGRQTSDVNVEKVGDQYYAKGGVSSSYVSCINALSPVLTSVDIPTDPDPEVQFHMRRLPLLKRALQAIVNNETINGHPAGSIKEILDYVTASFRFFHHVSIDPVLEEQVPQNSPLKDFIYQWQTKLQGSRLQMLSHGSLLPTMPISDLRTVLGL